MANTSRNQGSLVSLILRRGREQRLAQAAGGLTFATAMSMVPLLAVSFALFARVPALVVHHTDRGAGQRLPAACRGAAGASAVTCVIIDLIDLIDLIDGTYELFRRGSFEDAVHVEGVFFSSPCDDHINQSQCFGCCWLNSEQESSS
jgi:hypothetical protein